MMKGVGVILNIKLLFPCAVVEVAAGRVDVAVVI